MTLIDSKADVDARIAAYVADVVAPDWEIGEVFEPLMNADIEAAFPDRLGEDGFRQMLRGSVTENLTVLRDHLAGLVELRDGLLVRPVEFARSQAELGIPQAALQRSYRVGLQVLYSHWANWLTTCIGRDRLDPTDGVVALRISTSQILNWFDFVMATVDDAYARQDDMLQRSGAKARDALVREILGGELPSTPDDLYYTLRYDLTGAHVAVRLGRVSDNDARKFGSALLATTAAQSILISRLGIGEVMMWLGKRDPWTSAQLDVVAAELRTVGARAAIAEPASGVEGFRTGYRDVASVEEVRRYWGTAPDVLRFSDVRLEALLLNDIEAAKRFVLDELGPLADSTGASARLRETLLASFASRSHIDAAEALRLHEHTVRNRLRQAETLLGGRLAERRVELQMALRLHRLVL